ncbi:periaxin [Emydura macquarii macquarii]|uniref:periaxin n=1 Tax=Emydura macquarii macquarii TaxID=1129001 RepID=UPI00352A79F8
METQARVTEEAVKTSELVEIILETEAKAGISGISVAGGGKEGLFISDVLRESPAAKSLSLKEGDQLLSARVYFENVRYEDALKILKCAEPYKISFCLKRTVPKSDVPASPAAGGLEVKGPQAKMAKLNIKSLTPMKKKKKKVKGLVKATEEAAAALTGGTELSAGKLDVEFSLPKFSKLRRAQSTAEVGAAVPSPHVSAELSSSETKRRKLRFPRLKVKEAAGARALGLQVEVPKGKLEVALPKGSVETKGGEDGEAGVKGKAPTSAVPSPKVKKPQEEAGLVEIELQDEAKFKVPQIELDVPIPDLKALKAEEAGVEGPDGRLKTPTVKAPKLGLSLPTAKGEAEGPEGRYRAGMKLPALHIGVRQVDLEIPLPRGKADAERETEPELPAVTAKMPKSKAREEETEAPRVEREFKVPQVEVKVGKAEGESPETKAKGYKIKIPSFGISLLERQPNADAKAKEPAAEGKATFPGVKMPSIDISVPKVADVQLPKAAREPGRVKAPEADDAEGPEFRFKMPQVSLPKFDLPSGAGKAETPAHLPSPKAGIKAPQLEADAGGLAIAAGKISVPKLDISVPGIKPVDVELPEASLPKPELEIAVEKPKVEVKLPSVKADGKRLESAVETSQARLSFPSVKMPSLEIEMPKVGVDLDLPKATLDVTEGELRAEAGLTGRDLKLKMPKESLPKLGAVCKDLEVEIDVPAPKVKAALPAAQGEAELQGAAFEGPDLRGMVAKIPRVDLAFGKEEVEMAGPEAKGKVDKLPEVSLELRSPELKPGSLEAKVKLPSVEISTPKIPDVGIKAGLPGDLQGASAAVDAGRKLPETDPKLKSPKFSFPRFGISGPKVKKGGLEAAALEAELDTEANARGLRLKMPKFGLPFSKWKPGADVEGSEFSPEREGKTPKGRVELTGLPVDTDSSEAQAKLPSVKLPTVDISAPRVDVDIHLPKGTGDVPGAGVPRAGGTAPDVSIEVPDMTLKMPKFSLPTFGGKGKEEGPEVEPETRGDVKGASLTLKGSTEALSGELDGKAKGKESKMKMPRFKMPSFGISKKEAEVPGPGATAPGMEVKVKRGKAAVKEADLEAGSPAEKLKGPFVKMPKLKISSPKADLKAEADFRGSKGESYVQGPNIEIKMPQVELPTFGSKEEKADGEAAEGLESPGTERKAGKVKMPSLQISAPDQVPSLQISVPGVRAEGAQWVEKPVMDVSEADIQGYEGSLKIPKAPSVGVSLPKLDLDVSLPKPRVELLGQREVGLPIEGNATFEKADTKIKMPKVELPKYGGEAFLGKGLARDLGEAEAEMHLLKGQKLKGLSMEHQKVTLEMEGGKHATDATEASLLGSKIRVPKLDISLPKARLSDAEVPLTEGEITGEGLEEAEGKFKLPSVKLPKFSPPKVKAPEVGFDVGLSRERDFALDASGLHRKVPRVEMSSPKIKLPKFGGTSSDGQGEADRDSPKTLKVELKPPKLRGAEGADFSFKMPSIAMPDVGFSVGRGEATALEGEEAEMGGDARVRGEKPARAEDLEGDVGGLEARLKMPKIKMLPFGISGSQGDAGNTPASLHSHQGSEKAQTVGVKSLFKMPDLEISAPSAKTHAEYDVEGAQLPYGGATELQRTGGAGVSIKAPGGKGDALEADAGKKSKVKLPKFGIGLPRARQEGDERLSRGESKTQEAEAKAKMPKVKKAAFALGKPKGKGADASSGLLAGEGEAAAGSLEGEGEGKAKRPKIKLKPGFGLSLSKPKAGVEVNGELDPLAQEEGEPEKGSKLKLPKLGFSKTEVLELGINGKGSVSPLSGEEAEFSLQNGSQDGKGKLGNIKLPQVEFTSPYKPAEMDPEMNLKLVRTEEAKAEAHIGAFPALKVAKLKSPKITFSGFKRKEGEPAGNVVSSAARTEMALLEEGAREREAKSEPFKISLGFTSKAKGEYNVEMGQEAGPGGELDSREKSSKFKFPKLALSPKIRGVLEATSEQQERRGGGSQGEAQGSLEGFKLQMPKLGFSTQPEELSSEEQILQKGGDRAKVVTKTKQVQAEAGVGKSSAI